MSVQESIAAALGEHMLAPPGSSLSRWRCAFCDWEGDSFDSHLAAVAMDAARQAVAEMRTPINGAVVGLGYEMALTEVCALLTPEGER